MGYFETFARWLDSMLLSYIADNVARAAHALEPAIVLLGIFYSIVWGYLQLVGRVQEPFVEGVRRIIVLSVVLGVSLRSWLYHEVIVDTFFSAPMSLAAVIVGAADSIEIVDRIIFSGFEAAEALLSKGGILDANVSFYIAGFLVYAVVGVTAVYTMFLLSLSKIALSVLLALAPLFFPLVLFETTKRFFEAWLAQLANYGLVAMLAVFVSALMLHVLSTATDQAVSTGAYIQVSHAIQVAMTAVLTLLVLRQVMPMAAGLASGLSMSSFGALSTALSWGARKSSRSARDFARGMINHRGLTTNSSVSGRVGAGVVNVFASAGRRVARRWNVNTIRAVR